MDFKPFSQAVNEAYTAMTKHELFVIDVDADELWAHYLASFPAGTDPIYITNTEHTCSCCRNFVKHLGLVVMISAQDNLVKSTLGLVATVWDVAAANPTLGFYQEVAKSMQAFVRSKPIKSIFRTSEHRYGAQKTQQIVDGSPDATITWNHFWGDVASRHHNAMPDAVRGTADAKIQVFRRGLNELSFTAIRAVAELIETNNLYRGEEHMKAVTEFAGLHSAYNKQRPAQRELFVLANHNHPYAQFRNTVIGTLVTDLSNGMSLEDAVRAFEAKVAPTNYKRPKALVTPRMVQDATKTIEELGLESALPRRMAELSDISVNNVLWVSRPAAPKMKGGVLGALMNETVAQIQAASVDKAEDITIAEFMDSVLPKAASIDLWVANRHQSNFVAMTAAEVEAAPYLFKWPNQFGWSYDGNVADSLRERVKSAGGKVDVPLRVSLSWYNYDDLDLHSHSPHGHVSFMNRNSILDVDMNAGGGSSRAPVENQAWVRPIDGRYKIVVDQFRRREVDGVGFTLELACGSDVRQFSYKNAVTSSIEALNFEYKDGAVVNLKAHKDLAGTGISVKKWGVDTESFVPVNVVTYSPNHWDDQRVGNRHWFFLLRNCGPDLPVRGIYNEFLRSDLEQHRKVFEVLGDKTKCQPQPGQLAGLGFSSTREDSVTVRVNSAGRAALYNVKF